VAAVTVAQMSGVVIQNKKASSTVRLKRLWKLLFALAGQTKAVASSGVLQYHHADGLPTAREGYDSNPKNANPCETTMCRHDIKPQLHVSNRIAISP